MNLAQALTSLAAADTDAATSYNALRVVGAHLAGQVQLAPRAVAVAVDRDALDLQAGASAIFGQQPIYAVVARRANPWSKVSTQWINHQPPAHVPVVVFDRSIDTGATLRALLDELQRVDDALPITVLVVTATTKGTNAILADHPAVTIIAASSDNGAHGTATSR